MRRLLLVVLVLAGAGLVSPSPAMACSCAGVPEASAFASAEVVFLGEVLDFEGPRRVTGDLVTWTFEVTEVYKGNVAPTQEIVSREMAQSCGPWFTPDVPAYVFASTPTELTLDGGQYYASVCGPSRLATSPLGVAVVGRPPPGAARPDAGPAAAEAIGVAALAAAVLALAALHLRHRT